MDSLKEQNEQLTRKKEEDLKIQEYTDCHHLWVYTLVDHVPYEGRRIHYSGCMKCKLNQVALWKENVVGINMLSFEDQTMYYFLRGKKIGFGSNHTRFSCDIDLANAIYTRIKETHPAIDDELAAQYFAVALNDIRIKEVSKERQENRAKRLSLGKYFDRWHSKDIHR